MRVREARRPATPPERCETGQLLIDQGTLDHVRSGMLDGRVIPCRVPIDGLRGLPHPDDLAVDSLDVFLSYRAEIARGATETFARAGAPRPCSQPIARSTVTAWNSRSRDFGRNEHDIAP